MIVVITLLETTTAPHLNNILQNLERCEVAKGVGKRAADCTKFNIPSHKGHCVKARLVQTSVRS
jgi:hypothetical protein